MRHPFARRSELDRVTVDLTFTVEHAAAVGRALRFAAAALEALPGFNDSDIIAELARRDEVRLYTAAADEIAEEITALRDRVEADRVAKAKADKAAARAQRKAERQAAS